MNPFATFNDGLIDIAWIKDPAWNGVFGVSNILNEARSKAGIQVYKGHSCYMRGRKIKVTFKQRVGDI